MLEDYCSDSSSSMSRSLEEVFEQVSLPSKMIRISDYLLSICPHPTPPNSDPSAL